jgi:hypothetical protein
MSYSLIATGTAVSGFNATLTPPMPAGFSAGNLLLLSTGSQIGSLPSPTVAGWTILSPGVHSIQSPLYGKIAAGGDASPSVAWGSQFAWAAVTAYSGNQASLTGIVHASVDIGALSTNKINYPALTITQANCLVVCGGLRNKTSTSNGATAGTVGSFSIRNSLFLTSGNIEGIFNDWIQTTATSVPAQSQTWSIADSTSQNFECYVIALLPASAPPTGTSQLAIMGVG